MVFTKHEMPEDSKVIELMELFHENRIAMKKLYPVEGQVSAKGDIPSVQLEDPFDGLEDMGEGDSSVGL